MPFELASILRKNILQLTPYSSARHEFTGEAKVFLDANENSMGSPIGETYHRYPDPGQEKLKAKISGLKHIPAEQIFLGNGSDEAIDLLFRMFCKPGDDQVVVCQPTYGMYAVSAAIHDVKTLNVPLTNEFQLDLGAIKSTCKGSEKLLFICSPNNPSGNAFRGEDISDLLHWFKGIVVIDEAYIDFSSQPSWLEELDNFPNLVVLQTFSKAWGLAGLRLGMAFGSVELIEVMMKVKAPYNLSAVVQEMALKALALSGQVEEKVNLLLHEREKLLVALAGLPNVIKVYPSDANFVLVRFNDARKVYSQLLNEGIVVRDRSMVSLCEDCLRITIGSQEENKLLLASLQKGINMNAEK